MTKLSRLRQSRRKILTHIAAIEEMRRGSVARQFFKVKSKGGSPARLRGPYALYTCKKRGQTVGRRLSRAKEIRRLTAQVENYHAFRDLCSDLVDVAERICDEKEKTPGAKTHPGPHPRR
jgi:hypothetical protein